MYTVTVTYEVEANSPLHACEIERKRLKGKGEREQSEENPDVYITIEAKEIKYENDKV